MPFSSLSSSSPKPILKKMQGEATKPTAPRKGATLLSQGSCSEWFWHSFKTKIHLSCMGVWKLAKYSWIWDFLCSSSAWGVWDVSPLPITGCLIPVRVNLGAEGHVSHQGAVPDVTLKSISVSSWWLQVSDTTDAVETLGFPVVISIDSPLVWELCCLWTH